MRRAGRVERADVGSAYATLAGVGVAAIVWGFDIPELIYGLLGRQLAPTVVLVALLMLAVRPVALWPLQILCRGATSGDGRLWFRINYVVAASVLSAMLLIF